GGLYGGIGLDWCDAASMVIGTSGSSRPATNSYSWNNHRMHFQERMMFADMISYWTDDILVKVDRASMGVSLESRIPFLDHRVVEFAWQIPLSMKISKRTGQWLVGQDLSKFVA